MGQGLGKEAYGKPSETMCAEVSWASFSAEVKVIFGLKHSRKVGQGYG